MRRTTWVLAIVATMSCSKNDANVKETTPIPLPQSTSRRLTVDGTRLRDERGREVTLRGFNAGGRAKMAPYLPFDVGLGATVASAADAYFSRLAALGADVVRLTFSWEALESTRGTYDSKYLADYRTMLDAANQHELAVIVDFHQDVFASPFCGDGFPVWAVGDIPHGDPHYDCSFPWWSLPAFDAKSTVSQGFDRLWNDTDGLQADMEKMWREVARELGKHPAVAAFEVMNEPGKGSIDAKVFDGTTLPRFYERMGKAIREEAGDVAILWDSRIGEQGALPDLAPPSLPRAVFAPHYYETGAAIGADSVNEDSIRTTLTDTFAHAQKWNMPVILGEFGVSNSNSIKGDYLDFQLDLLDDLGGGHAIMWDGSLAPKLWNSEDFSVFQADGTEQPWTDSIVRAYPRAVAGHIVRSRWEQDDKRFELEVSDATTEVTDVYLPTRHVGTSPNIDVSGAQYYFDTTRERLVIKAEKGAHYTVVVTP